MNAYKLIRLRYGNSCDIGEGNQYNFTRFAGGELFDWYLDNATLGDPVVKLEELGADNENKERSYSKKIMLKHITLSFMGDEWAQDLVNLIELCDFKQIHGKSGEIYTIEEMEIESDVKNGSGLIQCKCLVERIIWESCCDNFGELDCNYNMMSFVAEKVINNVSSPEFLSPGSVPEGKYYILDDQIGGGYRLIQRMNGDLSQQPNQYYRFETIQPNKMVNDNLNIVAGKHNRWMADPDNLAHMTPAPTLNGITVVSTTATITGKAPEGYRVKLQTSADNITFTNVGTFIGGAVFTVDGKDYSLLLLSQYNRLALYSYTDDSEPCCYSNTQIIPS